MVGKKIRKLKSFSNKSTLRREFQAKLPTRNFTGREGMPLEKMALSVGNFAVGNLP